MEAKKKKENSFRTTEKIMKGKQVISKGHDIALLNKHERLSAIVSCSGATSKEEVRGQSTGAAREDV